MSPAVDFVNLPPIDPPPVAPSPPSAADGTPSFQDHLDEAGRRSQPPAPGPNDQPAAKSPNDRPAKDADAAKPTGDRPAAANNHAATTQAADADDHDKPEADKKDKDGEPVATPQLQVAAVPVVPIIAKPVAVKTGASTEQTATTDDSKPVATAKPVLADQPITPVTTQPKPVDAATKTLPTAAQTVVANAVPETTPIATDTTPVAPVAATAAAAPEVKAATQVDASAKPVLAAATKTLQVETTAPVVAAPISEAAPQVKAADPTTADDDGSKKDGDKHQEKTDAASKVADLLPSTVPTSPVVAAAAEAAIAASTPLTDVPADGKKDDGAATSKSDGASSPIDRTTTAEPPRTTQRPFDVGAARSGSTDGAFALPRADHARLVQRVAKAVQTATERGGELKLRLSPPELGSIRMHVELRDGALTARVETETHEARQVLVDALPQLRERLADQDIRVERFDVDLFNSGGGGGANLPDRRFDVPGDGTNRQTSASRNPTQAAPVIASTASSSPTTMSADGRLNVLI